MSEAELVDMLQRSNGWVVRNLKRYGNSVLPKELIAGPDDVRIGEKLLSVIIGDSVKIRKTDGGWICER